MEVTKLAFLCAVSSLLLSVARAPLTAQQTSAKGEAHPTDMQAQLGHSDPRTTLAIYTRTLGPEVVHMVNQVTNRILAAGTEGETGSVQ